MNVCGVLWKRHCELASVKLHRSRVVHPKPIRENRDAKREKVTGRRCRRAIPIEWTRFWKYPCQRGVRDAEAGCGKARSFPSLSRDPGATGRAD
jgi:hypothetical protein